MYYITNIYPQLPDYTLAETFEYDNFVIFLKRISSNTISK